ncbi:hypothetical protein [Micromonospora musae]|uniref:hypothetical protein n=1 Tax=Micromonospora musae TaxID=1894970 RepID=UPI00343BD47A
MNTGIDTTGTARLRPPPIVLASSLLLALSGLARLAQPAASAFYRRRRTSPYEPLIRYPDPTLPQPTGHR